MKKVLNVKEVRQAREENTPVIFNMVAALEAAKGTVAKTTKSGATGDFSKDLTAIFQAAGTPLAVNQVAAAYQAGKGGAPIDNLNKKIADRLWLLAQPKKDGSSNVLKKGNEKGLYELA